MRDYALSQLSHPGRRLSVAAGWLLLHTVSAFAGNSMAEAADPATSPNARIGPYWIGMSMAKARAARSAARLIGCNAAPGQRECLVLSAEVFGAPATLYAMQDRTGTRVEKIIALFDPRKMRVPTDRCVRLSETVFSRLVERLGPYHSKQAAATVRGAPAVAWHSQSTGHLVYEASCGTRNAGAIQITLSAFSTQQRPTLNRGAGSAASRPSERSRQNGALPPSRVPQARKQIKETRPRPAPRIPVTVSVLPLPPALQNRRPQQPPVVTPTAGPPRAEATVAVSADRKPKSKLKKGGSWLLWMPVEPDALYRSLSGKPDRAGTPR